MTATLDDVTMRKRKPEPSAEEQAAAELVRLARQQGLSLTGPDGLLKQLTKTVLETALQEEMTEHLWSVPPLVVRTRMSPLGWNRMAVTAPVTGRVTLSPVRVSMMVLATRSRAMSPSGWSPVRWLTAIRLPSGEMLYGSQVRRRCGFAALFTSPKTGTVRALPPSTSAVP